MTAQRKLAFDMSSFIWRGLLAGKDKEHGFEVDFNGKPKWVNSASYGYENIMNMMAGVLSSQRFQPIDCILVFEGKNSKNKRMMLDPSYKNGGVASHANEEYLEFQKVRDQLLQVWRDVGAMAMIQDGAEGDDTLGWLSQEWPGELTVATFDNDLAVLNSEDGEVNAYGGTTKVLIDGKISFNKYGAFDFKRIHIYKALVGDTSDGVPGAVGFGPGAFDKLVGLIGWDGMDELEDLLQKGSLGDIYNLAEETQPAKKKGTVEPTPLAKLVRVILDSEDKVIKAWKVTAIRPDWVNTMRQPLQIIYGRVVPTPEAPDERLAPFYGSSWLIDRDSYQDALETLQLEGPKGPFITFDIETSTPDESDDWLEAQGDANGVDQIGSELTGFSLTFGKNMELSLYVSVDHVNSNSITMSQARELLELVWSLDKSNVIHNTFFELSVIYNAADEDGTLWRDLWKDNGFHGFIPNALDTKLEASYVNENVKMGLKVRSKLHLDYEQTSYDETTKLTGYKGEMFAGGRLLREWEEPIDVADGEGPMPTRTVQERRYKMRELPAHHVFGYGVDDTACTAALHIGFETIMHLEHTWQVYLDVEIDAAYLHAKSFTDGMNYSVEKGRELEKLDDATYDAAWGTVRQYLIDHNWHGTVPPVFHKDITAAEIKYAYAIVTGQLTTDEDETDEVEAGEDDMSGHGDKPVAAEVVDPILKTMVRTPAKLIALIRGAGHEVFAGMLQRCLEGEAENFTEWVNSYFKGDPIFKISNKQMCHLLYDVMKCPIVVRGKATANMRAKGVYEGNPAGNDLAMQYALRDMKDQPEIVAVLQGLKLMQMVRTRRSLYYKKYPLFVHWKTGKIHGSHNQCATNTRRASESKPNKQQLPKHPKIEGQPARFRETIVPHRSDAVVVSMDFDSQELRIIADESQDPNMVACYVGDHKKDMHSLTGVGILQKRGVKGWDYETFKEVLDSPNHKDYKLIKLQRALGKKCNFTTEYGAMAPKLAATMLCSEAEAQDMIDAKEEAFPVAGQWKESLIALARAQGFIESMSGAKRHLRDALVEGDRWVQSKAERQGVNYRVQGSAAEMTKKAEGRMWKDGMFAKFDAVYLGPVHDECLASVRIVDLPTFLPRMHACMVGPFAAMRTVPIESSISFGPSFGDQVELGLVPTTEAIAKGLNAISLN